MLTTKEIIMLILMIIELMFVVYYKIKLHILEGGFKTLAKMNYKLSSKDEIENLARQIVEAQRNED